MPADAAPRCRPWRGPPSTRPIQAVLTVSESDQRAIFNTAWNNLGDALEQKKEFKGAIEAYEESLILSPGNKVATVRLDEIKRRQGRLGLLD